MSATLKKIPQYIIELVAHEGGRMTRVREATILQMSTFPRPQSIQEIVSRVDADEVSVYRTIAFFHSIGVVEEIIFPNGPKRYALAQGHHHHVICTSCGHVAHMTCDKDNVLRSLKKPDGFTSIHDHVVTYYGICTECSS